MLELERLSCLASRLVDAAYEQGFCSRGLIDDERLVCFVAKNKLTSAFFAIASDTTGEAVRAAFGAHRSERELSMAVLRELQEKLLSWDGQVMCGEPGYEGAFVSNTTFDAMTVYQS